MTYSPQTDRLLRDTEQSQAPSVYLSRSALPLLRCQTWLSPTLVLLLLSSQSLPQILPSLPFLQDQCRGEAGSGARGNCSNWNRKRVSSKWLRSVLLTRGSNILLDLLKSEQKKISGYYRVPFLFC